MAKHRHRTYKPPLLSRSLFDMAVHFGHIEVLDASELDPKAKYVAYNGGVHGPDPYRAARIGAQWYGSFDDAMRVAIESLTTKLQAGFEVIPRSIWVEEVTEDGFGITLWSCYGTKNNSKLGTGPKRKR